ncbi:MAG: aldo/keto reductase [Bdellovibrionia bacterium]
MTIQKSPEIPSFIYGTAWKELKTSELTQKAIQTGFRAIDTANQKKHYREDYVGEALLILQKQGFSRESLFLQSKYTYVHGQDQRLPYNPSDDFTTQVKSSFTSSLKNLHTDYLDSYLLHGPISSSGLQDPDWEVWNAMEALYESGKAKAIGISNVNLRQLQELTGKAKVQPKFVQNRCFASRGWDQQVREFCLAQGIIYQGFSLLTANPQVVLNPALKAISKRLGATPQQLVFRFAKQIGILPLTGSSDVQHMQEDLRISDFELSPNDMQLIEEIS